MMRSFLQTQARSGAVWRQTLVRKARFATAAARRAADAPPVAPPRPKKRHRIRNFFLGTTLLFGGSFAGAVYYSLKNDDFYYFFTTYIPMAGLVVDSVDDFVFRQNMRGRNPHPAFKPHRPAPASEIVSVDGTAKANAAPTAPAPAPAANPGAKAEKAAARAEKAAAQAGSAATQAGDAAAKAAEPAKASADELKQKQGVKRAEKAAAKTAEDAAKKAGADGPVALAGASPAVVSPVAGPRGSAKDSLLGLDSQELDPIVAQVAEALDVTLRAQGIRLDQSAFFASLASSVQRASDQLRQQRDALARQHEAALASQKDALEARFDQDYVAAKLNLVESYNQRLQLALDVITRKAVAAANNKLAAQNLELTEQFSRQVSALVEQERGGRLSQLAELHKDVATLQEAMLSSGQILESEDGVVSFFVELANLQRVLASGQTVPLRPYLDALKRALPSDPLVRAVYDAVSPSVKKYGVLSHPQLAARFSLIEPEIRRASLVPPDAGIAGHIGSLAASQLLARKEGLPAGDDVESILARTQTYLQQGDVLRAVAEVNSLQGWPKRIAGDWLDEGRKRSEMEFLVSVLADEGRLWSVSRK